MESTPCKGCTADVKVTEAQMARLWSRLSHVTTADLASEPLYQQRLDLCRECPSLQYGTTCQHCGCLVEWKAKLSRAKCPMPYAPKW